MTVKWVCPSCGTEWRNKPLVDGTIGCPECGSITEDAVEGWRRCIQALRLELPDAVWVDVQARSDRVLARLSAAEQERDEWRAACDSAIATGAQNADTLHVRIAAAEARAEAARQLMLKLLHDHPGLVCPCVACGAIREWLQ